MLVLRLLQEAPDTSLSWILYVLLGLLALALVVGALTRRQQRMPDPESGDGAEKMSPKAKKSSAKKKSRK